ncbi:hypothetical protein LPH50_00205 [Xylella taiwanensis]|uniref:Uncharacterized protein n=1 Tax=Xylella taiwanensis TaxID=1444770 RepID=Z9JG15_9GAMM|nr:hypothetical protein [Xylella taiwanensis]EWS76958.1 hypothetical protein AF72_13385 [Xylella taiwanensis]QKD98522.1 hypothetical protein PLS229_06405 [Xylella taiwanensis]UFM93786.1 hypothetical protein LPH39_00210 [Xylella taiwanensis]UFN02366.1 hypothetical protein LPH43_00285 [Xylella taiwanensis]UFN06835.1 hypothetical protein LPH42_00065 [Xylella taiwanensis]
MLQVKEGVSADGMTFDLLMLFIPSGKVSESDVQHLCRLVLEQTKPDSKTPAEY